MRLAPQCVLSEQPVAWRPVGFLTSQEANVAVLLQKYLRLDKQRVEAVQEEVPAQDLAIGQRVVQLVDGLQDDGPIDDEQVELGLQAKQQTFNRLIVNGSQVEGGPLGYVHIYVVHTSNQVTKSCCQGRLQSHLGPQRGRVHEPGARHSGEQLTSIIMFNWIREIGRLLANNVVVVVVVVYT